MTAGWLLALVPAALGAASWDFEGLAPGTGLRAGILPGWSQTGGAAGDGVVAGGPGWRSAGALRLERHDAHARLEPAEPLWRLTQGPVAVAMALRVSGRPTAINVIACQRDTAGAIVTLAPDAVLLGRGGSGVYTAASERLAVAPEAGRWYRLRLVLPAHGRTAVVHLAEADRPERLLLDGVETPLCGRLPLTRIERLEWRRFGGAGPGDRLDLDDLSLTPAGADAP